MSARKDPWGENVLVEFDEGIAWVTMNRPAKRNAMSPALNEEMLRVVTALATDDRCRVFVLTGAGESFAAGMDLKEYFRMTDGAPDTVLLNVRRVAEEWQWRRLRDYPKPTIETMGYRNSLYYAMTGETFDGKKAAEMGLVNEAVPLKTLRKRTRALAKTLLEKNQTVLRGVKIAMKRVKYMDWEVSADYLYAKMAEALHLDGGENRTNAMKAFLDDKSFRPGVEHFKGTK